MKKSNSSLKRFWRIFIISLIVLCLVSEAVLTIINNIINRGQGIGYVIPLYVMPFVALIFTLAFLYLSNRSHTKSQVLIDCMNKVAEGDYSVRIEISKGDKEYQRIYQNFNKMAEELASVRTMREDFIHDFSHEFKTPISSINGFATLLLEGGLSEEEQKKFLQIIADESVRLWHLADNTLTLSKLENQQLAGETTELRLDSQLNECIVMCERDWERKNLSVTSDTRPVTVRGNGALLMQVWVNLLSNAIKFTPEGGEIRVGVKEEDGMAQVTVSDTGEGIAAEDIDRVFEKYFRSGNAGKTEGNGLGLAICKRICVLSGGKISVESEKGKGSTFKVCLPLE